MTKKDLNNWIMYHEIHKLKRLGFSISKTARYLVMDARTVKKYLQMTEEDFEHYLLSLLHRNKLLTPYEIFVKEKLTTYQDTSSAQIHDWLKEHHPDLMDVTPRTVYNFVMFVRHKYNIPVVSLSREYFPIEELPYGQQAQVDFGEYNMRFENASLPRPGGQAARQGNRKKIWFFAMVLSRSRMKYIWFSGTHFTAETVSEAHEKAFAFFDGIPTTVVYDQDRTMVVDENMGDVILTSTFKQYTKSRNFKLHFCRKADPESKGKVENVIQYVKKNFLYNRPFSDIETLNTEALSWLARTANCLAHNYTKKSPESEYMAEKEHLAPYTPLTIENKETKMRNVRKTNVIAYKSNFYTVPMGTYQEPDSSVIVKENNGILEIYDLKKTIICQHTLSVDKGKTISNTNHKRDTSKSLDEMMNQTVACFTNQVQAMDYLIKIKEALPRYIRDQLQFILKALDGVEKSTADKALKFCIKNNNLYGNEFGQVLQVCLDETVDIQAQPVLPAGKEVKLLDKNNLRKASEIPEASNIDDYEDIINL